MVYFIKNYIDNSRNYLPDFRRELHTHFKGFGFNADNRCVRCFPISPDRSITSRIPIWWTEVLNPDGHLFTSSISKRYMDPGSALPLTASMTTKRSASVMTFRRRNPSVPPSTTETFSGNSLLKSSFAT